jgi:hypothetical protein
MKTAYVQVMGVGSEKKPKNQLTPESKNDADFWAGFRKGLGLKDGEEVGKESVGRNSDGNLTGRGNASGGRPTWGGSPISTGNIGGRPGFSAQDGILHGPGLNDEDIIDRDDYDSDNEYWDAVGGALSGYIESGDTRGAAGFMLSNNFNLQEMNRYLPGMAEQVSEMVSQETLPETNFVAPETVQPDYSEELNEVILKCCDEFYVGPLADTGLVQGYNAYTWADGIHTEWDFVGNKWWRDNPDTGYDSYIPDDLQGKIPSKNDDYFILNGHRMNREQFNNYVKGATAQYAFPNFLTSTVVNILGVGKSIFDNIRRPEDYEFAWSNEFEDSYFTYLGAWDMANGTIN